jgi:hypothetical protein
MYRLTLCVESDDEDTTKEPGVLFQISANSEDGALITQVLGMTTDLMSRHLSTAARD